MTAYQLDPDVVRWGLHLIDVCSISNNGSPETLTCYAEDLSHTVSVQEGYINPTHPFVENDEVIAHALQEELAKVPSSHDLRYSASDVEQHQSESVLAQDWLGPSGRHGNIGFHGNQEESNNTEKVLSDFEELSLGEEHQCVLPEIEDESDLDGELGKRLNQMIPVPHVPKINGEIPSADEATSDHERLLNRLQLYDLFELKILGDGNCQFRSLSDQIYRTSEHHKFVREQVVNQLKSQPELYNNYVPMAYADYLKKMSKSGEWGDHVTLQAAADSFGVKIFIITSFKDTCYIEILPQIQKSNRIKCSYILELLG
ncbi:OVARIAN TUMOR DOMAIN-containing deubiquitinating enzyme 9-like isoform X2 [Andrographis paniculata]|uniref:OVARIAN TUMOR DOMAIN-containing deubiquitinating enzyme 9-like isoform X2 n=1 Tax=Andrographis paniculata TaxID=175694 RepID=UPI0021E9815A|nr:OVARIAN TUMOR DOMAIN-containing deubiquitinating enzyme 9-like isoform X2 [Andrographis paniculata]